MQTLSPRQQSIFNRVVDTYIETGQPVGSRSITDLFREIYQDTYSSATVRQEMGVLEQQGYLTHPHTSAGRIPTDQGYRYYVDYGVQRENLPPSTVREIRACLDEQNQDLESFIEAISLLLSQLTEQIGVMVVLPKRETQKRSSVRLSVRGTRYLLEKPEFQNMERIKKFLGVMEERLSFCDWLQERTQGQGISVTIGRENKLEAFQECAVISAPCVVEGRSTAVLALMGPRRMRYGQALPLVQYMTDRLSRNFGEYFDEMS